MSLYIANCVIDEGLKEKLQELKENHLAYIGENKSLLRYGGVVVSPEGEYQEIVYILKFKSRDEAEHFITNDPYNLIYKSTTIRAFDQKIPKGDG